MLVWVSAFRCSSLHDVSAAPCQSGQERRFLRFSLPHRSHRAWDSWAVQQTMLRAIQQLSDQFLRVMWCLCCSDEGATHAHLPATLWKKSSVFGRHTISSSSFVAWGSEEGKSENTGEWFFPYFGLWFKSASEAAFISGRRVMVLDWDSCSRTNLLGVATACISELA